MSGRAINFAIINTLTITSKEKEAWAAQSKSTQNARALRRKRKEGMVGNKGWGAGVKKEFQLDGCGESCQQVHSDSLRNPDEADMLEE